MKSSPALFVAVVLLGLSASPANAGGSLKSARDTWLKGNYAEAQEIYAELNKNPKLRAAASIGLSKALESEGEYDKALAAIDAVWKDAPDNADVLARRAEILFGRGRWDEAAKSAQQAIDEKEDHLLARWVLAVLERERGNHAKADDAFRWFVRTYTQRSNAGMDITDPDELHLVGKAAAEYARYHQLSEQFDFLVNTLYADALSADKRFWQAEFEKGRIFQEKHNKAAAERAYTRALVLNPRAAEVFVARGEMALARLEIKDVEQLAEQALAINPKLPEALRLKADVHLFSGELAEAQKALAAARAVNPRDQATLALVAVCLHAQKKQAEFQAVIKEVESFNPNAGVFYHELAERFDGRKLYFDAEQYFKKAVALQPKLPWPQNGLGLLYMRLGREDEAREILEKAFEADAFNIRVSNTLKVLDHLDKYQTLKTEHFHLRYDPKNDKILANFMAKYLEDIYKELADKFDYRPPGPFLIEVFNKHEMFSGRVVALPDLHTIGACTGRMVAMVSPRDKSKVINKPFNWNRVLRHELVHVFNLDQTKFVVPHWFTEGLAVSLEGTGTPPTWNYILTEKVTNNDLLNLDNILLGFVRPRSPDQWQQAYLQSLLYVEYLTQTCGDKAIGQMLAAYADGLDTDSALRKVAKTTKADFEKGYRKFLDERVDKLALKTGKKRLAFKELKAAHEANPEDADLAAQLADVYLSRGDNKEARRLAELAMKLKRNQPLAAYVRAVLLVAGGDPEIAYTLLEAAVDEHPTEPKAIKLLAKMHFDAKKTTAAANALELGRKLEPNDPTWVKQLAKVYLESNDEAKLTDVLAELTKLDYDDLGIRRKLAQLYAKAGKHAEAERIARQALEIDVLDESSQDVLIEALTAQNKERELAELKKLLERDE
ncbi:MAG: tetratricopeptide repeat protein [Gemmataceae bacterium]|nr:tetratricopeptide repeat protein [Gemmataceae bacterium]